MVARFSTDGHSWSNHIPSSAGGYSRWMFLVVRSLPLFSFLSLFSPRLFPTWLASLPRISSLLQYVWPLLCSCTHAFASANHYRCSDTTGVSIPITYPFVYFAALRVTDLTVMLFRTAPGFLRFSIILLISLILYWRSLLFRLYSVILLRLNQYDI